MLLVVEKTYGNLIRYGFFEDATIELNNVYGWKRHNAQCQKIGHVLQILTHQYFSQNKAHSLIA